MKLRGDGAQLSDAAFALEHHYGGLLSGRTDAESFALFMERINARAQELGLLDTQHLNPSGLAWDGHYSSAFDLAYLAIYGRANSVLVEIVGTQSHVVHGSRTSCSEIPISCWVSSAWMA